MLERFGDSSNQNYVAAPLKHFQSILQHLRLNPMCILIKSNSVVATHLVLAYSWLSTFSPGSRNKQKCWQSRQFLQTCTKLHSLCHIPCQFVAMVLALLCTLYTRAGLFFHQFSLNSRRFKLKVISKLKSFRLNSSKFHS